MRAYYNKTGSELQDFPVALFCFCWDSNRGGAEEGTVCGNSIMLTKTTLGTENARAGRPERRAERAPRNNPQFLQIPVEKTRAV
jgi:hypothetical protein